MRHPRRGRSPFVRASTACRLKNDAALARCLKEAGRMFRDSPTLDISSDVLRVFPEKTTKNCSPPLMTIGFAPLFLLKRNIPPERLARVSMPEGFPCTDF